MSSEQLLLTLGVALLVFDSKKIPKLLTNIAVLLSVCRQYYNKIISQIEQVLHHEMNRRQLEVNQKKAEEVEEEIR